MINKEKHRITGIILAIVWGSCWVLACTLFDLLIQQRDIDINWYVTARLLISGIVLLAIYKIRNRKSSIFSIFKNRHHIFQLLIFSIFGMLLVQYAYMASINYGNAAIATLL